MRQAAFDHLEFFPLVLDAATTATLACSKISLVDLINSAMDTFEEETGKKLTLAQAITLIDDQTQIAQEREYWENVTLRTARVKGISYENTPETTLIAVTFNGTVFATVETAGGAERERHEFRSLADALESFDAFVLSVKRIYAVRREKFSRTRKRVGRCAGKTAMAAAAVSA